MCNRFYLVVVFLMLISSGICGQEISKIDKKIELKKGWNWLSFPKLLRANNDPYPAQTLLENLEPMPNILEMLGWNAEQNQGVSIRKVVDDWSYNGLGEVHSTQGYKLSTSNSGPTILPLTGTDLNPNWPIQLYSGPEDDHENWVGYFLRETQDPFQALSDVMPALKSISGQEWAAVNIGTQYHPYWISSPPMPLEYGDMLVLRCFYNTSFSWSMPQSGIAGDHLTEPKQFQYEELADYTGFFIEIDTANSPLEIGAYAGDSCIGACVVKPGDTLVLVRGYTGDNGGDSITFQPWYGTKSTQQQSIDEYFVYNVEKQSREKRCILTGEKKDFYLISLKSSDKPSIMDRKQGMSVSVYPNPSSGRATIEFVSGVDGRVKLEVYDLTGRMVHGHDQGWTMAGKHLMEWELRDSGGNKVPAGLYTILVKCNGDQAVSKIMVQ